MLQTTKGKCVGKFSTQASKTSVNNPPAPPPHPHFPIKNKNHQIKTEKGSRDEDGREGAAISGVLLLTGPTGRAINNLVQCLTWDLVSGGDILAKL